MRLQRGFLILPFAYAPTKYYCAGMEHIPYILTRNTCMHIYIQPCCRAVQLICQRGRSCLQWLAAHTSNVFVFQYIPIALPDYTGTYVAYVVKLIARKGKPCFSMAMKSQQHWSTHMSMWNVSMLNLMNIQTFHVTPIGIHVAACSCTSELHSHLKELHSSLQETNLPVQ